MIRKAAFLAALLVGAAAASAAPSAQQPVTIEYGDYAPAQVNVLRGTSVEWTNGSTRKHTVTDDAGAFDSGVLFTDDHYTHAFDTDGQFTYHCTQHPFMHGEVDVSDVILDKPSAPASPGKPFPFHGETIADPGTPVSIQADTGSGFSEIGTTTVASDGTFSAAIAPTTTGSYRALVGSSTSPPVELLVLDRQITATARRNLVTVRVTPASPGATVVLQLHLRERFGWWPVRQVRIGPSSAHTFRVRTTRPVSARVVLTLPDGATPLATSPVVRVRPA